MGGVNYGPLIRDMTWSHTRLKAFETCPYGWYLRYILGIEPSEKFYASFGSFMHSLIERYYRGELTKEQMLLRYYMDFRANVVGARPKESTLQKYIQGGADYLKSFRPFPYNMLAVEKRMSFDLDGIPFVAVIDYLGEKDGDLYIIDNKSRALKPRSGRDKPTIQDKELDEMLRQLYLYCYPIKEEYGKFPKQIGFNCFRIGEVIMEDFNETAYNEAVQWEKDTVREIENTNEFPPNENAFYCFWLCGVERVCQPYQESCMERRRMKG